jgi:glycosyltransferase involved in cell wall biosynthesis
MKIALLAPPWISLPPDGYGGTESVVYNLSEQLVKRGHQVIVCATGDSKVSAKLLSLYKQSLGVDRIANKYHVYYYLNHIHACLKELPKDIDIIHNHCEALGAFLLAQQNIPFVHTLHLSYFVNTQKDGDVSYTDAARQSLDFFKEQPYISISDFQRTALPQLNYIRTVYNGVQIDNLPFYEKSSQYMGWLGSFTPIKGLEKAVALSKAMDIPLEFGVKIRQDKQELFDQTILPHVDDTKIINHGEIISDTSKAQLIGPAKLTLFPVTWDEPFGLVMIESMACGTPVVGFARGAVQEVVKDGETGFLVNPSDDDIRGEFVIKKTGMAGLEEAVERIYSLPEKEYDAMRVRCRTHVSENFTVEKMIDGYEAAYREVLQNY